MATPMRDPAEEDTAPQADDDTLQLFACWSTELAHATMQLHPCMPFWRSGSRHLRYKFCIDCREEGVRVPANRIRMQNPLRKLRYTDGKAKGVWSILTFANGCTVSFRCAKPDLLIFASELEAASMNLLPVRATLVDDSGHVHFQLQEHEMVARSPVGSTAIESLPVVLAVPIVPPDHRMVSTRPIAMAHAIAPARTTSELYYSPPASPPDAIDPQHPHGFVAVWQRVCDVTLTGWIEGMLGSSLSRRAREWTTASLMIGVVVPVGSCAIQFLEVSHLFFLLNMATILLFPFRRCIPVPTIGMIILCAMDAVISVWVLDEPWGTVGAMLKSDHGTASIVSHLASELFVAMAFPCGNSSYLLLNLVYYGLATIPNGVPVAFLLNAVIAQFLGVISRRCVPWGNISKVARRWIHEGKYDAIRHAKCSPVRAVMGAVAAMACASVATSIVFRLDHHHNVDVFAIPITWSLVVAYAPDRCIQVVMLIHVIGIGNELMCLACETSPTDDGTMRRLVVQCLVLGIVWSVAAWQFLATLWSDEVPIVTRARIHTVNLAIGLTCASLGMYAVADVPAHTPCFPPAATSQCNEASGGHTLYESLATAACFYAFSGVVDAGS